MLAVGWGLTPRLSPATLFLVTTRRQRGPRPPAVTRALHPPAERGEGCLPSRRGLYNALTHFAAGSALSCGFFAAEPRADCRN